MVLNDLKVRLEDFKGKNIQGIAENTVLNKAEELKRLFDAPAQEVMAEKFNALIDFLNSTEAGENIKVPDLADGAGTTIADQMAYLLDEVKNMVLGKLGFEPVRYDIEQQLTEEEQTIAQKNIGSVPTKRKINGKPLNEDVDLEMNDITKGIAAIERGGTGAGTTAGARQNINMIGNNPVSTTGDDTPARWMTFGTGAAFFNKTGCLIDQPMTNGMVVNYIFSNNVVQLFLSRGDTARMWLRAGQESGWNCSWRVAGAEHSADKTNPHGVTADQVGAVPVSRTINGKALNANLTLNASDVGAAPTSHGNHVPATQTASNKVFLRNDNTWQTITPANIGAAPSSHGNHVPTPQTASNKKFLRNDNSWQEVTPANIGAAASGHNHDGSYFKKYDLNGCNVDSTDGNWTVDISDTSHGTVPKSWVNVQQFTSGHFKTQIAQICNSDSNAARIDGRMWIRNKYSSGAWGAWTVVYTEWTTKNEGINLGTGNGKITGDVNGWIHLKSNGSTIVQRADSSTSMFYPAGDNVWYLGGSSYRWKAVYGMTSAISTSDRNQKENIKELEQKYIDLFDKLQPVSYEFIGEDHDRVHIGFISQDVKAAMDEVGLTDLDFAGYCRDEKKEATFDEKGDLSGEKAVLDENGNPEYIYSLRYAEFVALNTKMIQMCREQIADQQKEIEMLKAAVQKLTREGET